MRQFVIFNPRKAFYQNSFVKSHLIRQDSGQLANEALTSNPIVSSKHQVSGLKITNWRCSFFFKKRVKLAIPFVRRPE